MAQESSLNGHRNEDQVVLFPVVPLLECPHLEQVEPVPEQGLNVNEARCVNCNSANEPWCCLNCYTVTCSRHVNGHAINHFEQTLHCMTLSFSDLSVWCYACNAYVHNPILIPAKDAAHRSKFGMPYPEVELQRNG
ncbi:hypothetical protein WR25_19167 [Diploscapter pachys]|uniref:UBP-type domain-containing protein n=1 Tax=Diploscapter pachys TaxID=2018661 RepID=A0A2A2KH99_9BILA|nr:hypothetical protein WR25_19167 [Diploscapter pachys]